LIRIAQQKDVIFAARSTQQGALITGFHLRVCYYDFGCARAASKAIFFVDWADWSEEFQHLFETVKLLLEQNANLLTSVYSLHTFRLW